MTHYHNWPKGEYCLRDDMGEKPIHEIYSHIDPELLERFDEDYVPYGDEGNVHTIESIEIMEVSDIKDFLE